jgi:hypothetical protein
MARASPKNATLTSRAEIGIILTGGRREKIGGNLITGAKSTRRLRIPVRFVDCIWECALGGAVPVNDGTEAELVIPRVSISDKSFLETMERKGLHKVLEEGVLLLVCLTVKPQGPVPERLMPLLKSYNTLPGIIATQHIRYWNPSTIRFVEVRIGGPDDKQARLLKTNRGGLWLMTEGVEAVGLASTTVLLPPAISEKPVDILNHAYTKLSEIFETWRKAHTGNIYDRVLYQERNGTWYPLDILRNNALEKQEQEIARTLWENLIAKMTLHQRPQE